MTGAAYASFFLLLGEPGSMEVQPHRYADRLECERAGTSLSAPPEPDARFKIRYLCMGNSLPPTPAQAVNHTINTKDYR